MKKLHQIILWSIILTAQSLFSCITPTLSTATTRSFSASADFFAYSPDRSEVAVSFLTGYNQIRIISSVDGSDIATLNGNNPFASVAYSPDGLYLAVISVPPHWIT